MKSSLDSLSTKMKSKLLLILFGALITIAVLSATENMEENSLSEEIASSRLARAADADPTKSKKKSRKPKKNMNASKKKNKSEGKNQKASNKERQSKRKTKKASKKGKKSIKSKKFRKNKKNRQGESTVPDTCATTAVNALYNGLKKKAANFDSQSKRIESRLPKIANKLPKASEYNQTMDDLVAAGASGCPAISQALLTTLVATLSECQTNIETACAAPMINRTQIDECTPIVEGFVAEVEKCFGLSSDPAAACECWESDAMTELYEGLKGCVIKESEANVTAGFKACKGAVSTCNKAQVEAIPVLVNCSKSDADDAVFYTDFYLKNATPYNMTYHVTKRACDDESGIVYAGKTKSFGVGWCEIEE